MMKLAVIESPYSASNGRSIEDNVEYARACMRDAIDRGYAPIASHLLYTQDGILNDEIPTDRSLGIAMGLDWACLADVAIFYTDFGMSDGMRYASYIYEREDVPMEQRTIY